MALDVSPVLKSYLKTTAACTALGVAAPLAAAVALRIFPGMPVAGAFAWLCVAVTAAAALLAASGALVALRYRRASRGARDLFLSLNRSREAAAITAAAPPRPTRARRWLARRLMGHDLLVGDVVEIKAWPEIRTTLDESGCFENVPFMPEMLRMCGTRARVFRSVHRLFDYRKSRKMRHLPGSVLLVGAVCDGSSHGRCEAGCHTIWKATWLRRVDPHEAALKSLSSSPESGRSDAGHDTALLELGTQPPRFRCQLTQLHDASQPVQRWSFAEALRPLVSGNVAPAAFAVGWLTYLFNELQHLRGGFSYPEFEPASAGHPQPEDATVQVGDLVRVRSAADIRTTLNDRLVHRGMSFDPDMLKHCGRRYCVQAEIKRVIDIVTGEMLTMKTPAYVLRDVHFSGERQLFNAQYEPLFWRAVWLEREAIETAEIKRKSAVQRA